MMKKKICILFGGVSVEHEISIISANSILNNIDRKIFDIQGLYLNKNGDFQICNIKEKDSKFFFKPIKSKVFFSLNKENNVVIETNRKTNKMKIDIFFPIIHGTGGEDGSIQGFLKTLDVPFVGCDVLSSAMSMDKIITKKILISHGVRTANFIEIKKNDKENIIKIKDIGFPCFVKAANLGSSIGVFKVKEKSQLKRTITKCFQFSNKVFIEEAINDCIEVEVSILGNDKLHISTPGDVLPSSEFYDYNAKYIDGKSELNVPSKIIKKNKKLLSEIKQLSEIAYKALGCTGMARIDFLYGKNRKDKTRKIYFSEINSIPGFTEISMFPKLLNYDKIKYQKIITRLINLGFEIFNKDKKLKKTYC